jgi:predicted PurR-regulated permease PerM
MNNVRTWVMGAAVVAGAVLIWDVLSGAVSALLLLFTAVLVAAGLRPIVDRMAKRMPYGVAVSLAFVAVIAVIVIIAALLIQPLGAELVKLIQSLPGYATALQSQLEFVQRHFETNQTARQIAGALAGSAGSAASAIGVHLLSGTAITVGAIGNGVLILLLAVGWMLSSDDLARFVLSLMPPATRSQWREALEDIAKRLSAYVGGVVINGSIVGIAMGISLALLGAPYYLLLGFIAALFQAIPMLGAVISGPIILLVVLATSGWSKMLIALVIFAVVQIVDQNVLSPIIFGQRVQLSFLLIILATVVGGTLLGIGGAFLAVPAAAVLQVLVVRIVAPAIRGAHEKKRETA